MDRLIDVPALEGWIPIRLYREDEQTMVDWCYLGTGRFSEPFFSQTVEDCLRLPFNMIFRHQTSIEVLGRLNQTRPGLQPDGYLYMSRAATLSQCGCMQTTL